MRGSRAGLPLSRWSSRDGVGVGCLGQGRQAGRDTTPGWGMALKRNCVMSVGGCSFVLFFWKPGTCGASPPAGQENHETGTACRTRRCSGAVVGRVDTREYAGEDGKRVAVPPVCASLRQSAPLQEVQVHLVRLMEGAVGFENIGTPVPPQRSLSLSYCANALR